MSFWQQEGLASIRPIKMELLSLLASMLGHLEVVRELLTAGADHTLAWIIDDQRKETPLEAAHRNGHHRIVQLLEEYGALA